MNWFETLLTGESIAHSVLVIALVIALGTALGKIKIAGISLGVTWVLFAGIAASHFGLTLNDHVMHFVKEFGLIIFIFALGLQVGPGFFASFKKGGLSMVGWAVIIVLLGVGTTALIAIITGTPISTMAGVMSGAVTNTPGLGAAQTAYGDMHAGAVDASIANGYAVAYPIGAVGVILCMLLFRAIFKVKLDGETAALAAENGEAHHTERLSILLTNNNLIGRRVADVRTLLARNFVISRVRHDDGGIEIASSGTVLREGDKLLVICDEADRDAIMTFFGVPTSDLKAGDWVNLDTHFVSRSVVVTKSNVNGKKLSELKLRSHFGINVTRVSRAGIELVAAPDLELQMGDKLTVVGTEESINSAGAFLGNSTKHLRHPNLIAIFVGITLGVLLGSIPIFIPGIPEPLKLGLAGGPLIVAILIGRFGPHYKLVTYTTLSANLMLREVGISLFLACVGLGAGETFISSIVDGGYWWVIYGALITILPILVVAIPLRVWGKMNYFRLVGLVAGSHTNPMALAYANSLGGNDQPSVAYSTVYPFIMFLRILAAQVLVMMAI
ncbi:MAG: putative transporter [Alistipes sp.]|jgi:putative transport protein|nr:putative transporter [Alistipes sp.]